MEMSKRTVDWLAIDLLSHETRKRQAARAMTLEERTKRALAKARPFSPKPASHIASQTGYSHEHR
jgi:hypothetical protein